MSPDKNSTASRSSSTDGYKTAADGSRVQVERKKQRSKFRLGNWLIVGGAAKRWRESLPRAIVVTAIAVCAGSMLLNQPDVDFEGLTETLNATHVTKVESNDLMKATFQSLRAVASWLAA